VIELWHEWNSVHSYKVRVVLAEKGLQWKDNRVELLKLEQLNPAYLKLNPNATVPTLVHEGRVVVESSIICEYLEETFPEPVLMPADPFARAGARRWLKYHDEVAHAALRKASLQLMFKPAFSRIPAAELAERLRTHPNPERVRGFRDSAAAEIDFGAVREAMEQCVLIAARIDAALEGRPWLGGESFGMADVAMAPFAERIDNLDMSFVWASRPRAAAWAERTLSRASVRQSMPPAAYRLPAPSGPARERVREIAAAISGASGRAGRSSSAG
jgi:glutathione S-transferase